MLLRTVLFSALLMESAMADRWWWWVDGRGGLMVGVVDSGSGLMVVSELQRWRYKAEGSQL
jgi:hypothetical protein